MVSGNLNKRSVTKETLCGWLETMCFVLNRFASPHLQMAVERIDKMNTELLQEKQTVIDLQAKLIEKGDEELTSFKTSVQNEVKSVQSVLQTEMKSYSSAVKKTCAAALAPQKISAAVKSAASKEERNSNVIIYGVKENDGEVLVEEVIRVLSEIEEKPAIRDCCRVGVKRTSAPRPIKFTLSSSDMVNQVLRKAKQLRTKEGYRIIYISPDRSVEERRAFKKLWEELLTKRKIESDKVHFIRNNKIVSFLKDGVSAPSDNS